VKGCLAGTTPIIAATDYVCAYPQMIAAYIVAPFVALGTDGFGRMIHARRCGAFLRSIVATLQSRLYKSSRRFRRSAWIPLHRP